ncbi:DegQ family serine endoprotease [Fulvimarina endophytica]|uniref:DegQ family serine endoprotease n=1 Tax=Fulvimarina endophytica TaxID=2293836 RepID=A0A371WZZ9_9HYPH|nr:DegQ family serine endoprotease [Fulvimarina endophytica]RFC62354.1 DegQ family serine endoprotease [Fulvimarina endophytica]
MFLTNFKRSGPSLTAAAISICLFLSPLAGEAHAEGWGIGNWFGWGSDESADGRADGPAPVPAAPVTPEPSARAEPASPSAREQVPATSAEITLTFAPLVRETAPAVVNVYAARAVPQRLSPFAGDPFFEQFFGRQARPEPRIESSLGSGVIVDPSGLVVTNNHVIADADEVRISFADGREFETEILLKDAKVDLAVLRIEGGEGTFPTVGFGNSDGLEIGDLVLAIGNPFGIGQTVTNGIVSALARTHLSPGDPGVFIQTDAAINPGNSGGALIDMRGRLIGVNTAIFSKSGGSNGIGFAIPSNLVASFVAAAKAGGAFERPYVGATFGPVTADLAEALGLAAPTGVIVHRVGEGSPAEKAGLRDGDVVTAVGSARVSNPDALGYQLATAGIGSTIALTVLRDGEQEALSLDLVGAPEVPARDERSLGGRTPFAGAVVWNLSPKVAETLDLPMEKTGVVVAEVERGSLAARFGLQPKDIIVTVNRQDIASTQALEHLLAEDWNGYDFQIERGGRLLEQRVR